MAEVKYTDDNIRTLEGIEHIRRRPGMYIGRLGDGSHADDGIEATTYGEDDLIHKMIWGHDGYVYSMTSTAGIDSDTAAQLLVQAY